MNFFLEVSYLTYASEDRILLRRFGNFDFINRIVSFVINNGTDRTVCDLNSKCSYKKTEEAVFIVSGICIS